MNLEQAYLDIVSLDYNQYEVSTEVEKIIYKYDIPFNSQIFKYLFNQSLETGNFYLYNMLPQHYHTEENLNTVLNSLKLKMDKVFDETLAFIEIKKSQSFAYKLMYWLGKSPEKTLLKKGKQSLNNMFHNKQLDIMNQNFFIIATLEYHYQNIYKHILVKYKS